MDYSIQINTSSYNERRMGKPWIATVSFAGDGKANFAFGAWIGSPGSAGRLEIEAPEGAIIATGQKDHRKDNSNLRFFQVLSGGELTRELSKVEAVDAYRKEQNCRTFVDHEEVACDLGKQVAALRTAAAFVLNSAADRLTAAEVLALREALQLSQR
jgi:hypothetical protein